MPEHSIPSHVTGLYLFAVVNLVIMLNVSMVGGEVQIIETSKNKTIETFDDYEAGFGTDLGYTVVVGQLVYVTPRNGCESIRPPPPTNMSNPVKWIALIARGSCDFSQKVYRAQESGFALAIVHNHEDDDRLIHMQGDIYANKVVIPAVFVGWTAGVELAKHDYRSKDMRIRVDNVLPNFDYREYLWPFAIVVATCFCLMVAFMCLKLWRDRRQRMRSRLSTKHLKKIPTKKFKKGDHYDVCAVCLDEYEEGEKLRILPCSHAYHSKCIDPWLTKNKKTCPVCKRRVIPGEEDNSDTDSDAENGNTSDERTPLLSSPRGGNQPSTSGNTFQHSGLPPPLASAAAPPPPVLTTPTTVTVNVESEEEDRVGAVGREVAPAEGVEEEEEEEEDYETANSGETNGAFHDAEEVEVEARPRSEPAPPAKRDAKKDTNQVV